MRQTSTARSTSCTLLSCSTANTRLQAYISKVFIEDFALVSDSAYVAQNAGRIIRALLEIALSRNWANCALLLIDLSKAIERRMWPYEHPLQQMTLQRDTLYNLRRWADDTEISELREMDAKSLGDMVHLNELHGKALLAAANEFPTVSVQYALRPLAHDLLEISVSVEPSFKWSQKVSGTAEPFYVWVQDEEGINILQWRNILLRPSTTAINLDFVIPWTADTHHSLSIVTASDKWLGSDSQAVIDLSNLAMPAPFDDHTPLLDLPFLTLAALDDAELAQAYRPVSMLNGLQSQVFWSVYHTQHNVLVSAPVSSGKSLLGEMAIWHAFRHNKDALVVVVVPHFRAAGEAAARIRSVTPKSRHIRVTHVRSSEALESSIGAEGGRVVVATPSAFDHIAQERLENLGNQLSLVVFEDLHLLDPVYELNATKLLSVARPSRTRVVGLTCSLSDPTDVASWLGVEPQYRFNFFPRDRGSPVVVHLKTFTTPHSATLLKTMIKPTYDIIKEAPGNTIVFAPSRAACRNIARDLVTQSGTAMDLNGFLNAQRADVEPLVANLSDTALLEPLLHGIGYILPSTRAADLALVLELFASGVVRVLIAPRDACWTLPVRASTVVLMGAQYTQLVGPDERVTTNYSRHELVKMQSFAVLSAHPAAPGGRMHVLCQAEQQTSIARLLSDGLPLESDLPAVLRREVSSPNTQTAGGGTLAEATTVMEGMFKHRPAPPPPQPHRPRVPDLRKRDVMDMIGWTLLGRRVRSNPTFYGMMEGQQAEMLSRMVDAWFAPRERAEKADRRDKEKEEKAKGKGKETEKGDEQEDDKTTAKVGSSTATPDGAATPVTNGAPGAFKPEDFVVEEVEDDQ